MKKEISEISVVLDDSKEINSIADALKAVLPPADYEIQTWRELLPLITAYLSIYDGFIFIWFVVVFIAMGFGIVNTTLMAVFERIREFGLLKSLGMKPWWVIKEVLVESFYILLIGMIIGNIFSFLSVLALSANGIDLSSLAEGSEFAGIARVIYPALHLKDLIVANLVVFVLGLVVSLYPAVKAARFTPIEALAQN
jgi:ABC-type lipoprotein release transport system permease subunit